MVDSKDNRSLGELLTELSRETRDLVRKEVELATTEMTAKVRTAAMAAGIVTAGGALIHAGVLILLGGIVIGLAEAGLSPWLSAFIVAAATLVAGYLLVSRGLTQLRRTSVAPTQALDSLKETASWTTRQGA